jgi:dipeptidase
VNLRADPQLPVVLGCDSVVALAPAAAAGSTLFGKNSDRPPGEPQAPILIESARHPAGATVRCQYVDVPQVRATARVLGSRPTWLWGFEMGLNEHGVAIGNETIFAHEAPAATGLTGMDLVRLGLERADSAARALEVVEATVMKRSCAGAEPQHSATSAADTDAYGKRRHMGIVEVFETRRALSDEGFVSSC